MTPLGPATEARLAAAFADKPLLNQSETARVLTLDRDRLRVDIKAGRIQGQLVGKRWMYSEAALRVYLGRLSSPSTSQKAQASTSTSSRSTASATTARRVNPKSEPPLTWSARKKTPLKLVSK